MRTCMYCGRELEKGEICDCPQSVMRRNAKEQAENTQSTTQNTGANNTENTSPNEKQTSYKTGYAGDDNRFERARNKYRAKREARKNAASNGGGFWSDLWHYVYSAARMPVQTVINPKRIGKGAMLLIFAVLGAVLSLFRFYVMRGGSVGLFKLLSSVMSFGGEGYRLIGNIALCILSGAVSGIVIFFLYTGIFYLINRFIIKMKTPYWEFCTRLVTAWIPFTIYCLIGAALSLLSLSAMAAFVLCGAAVAAVLTYEALKTEWYSVSPSKVLGTMALGYFVFFTIMDKLI